MVISSSLLRSSEDTRTFHSVTGSLWQIQQPPERDVLSLVQKCQVPTIVAVSLVNRGVKLDEVDDFLHPTLKQLLPDPFHLLDMSKAAERLVQAVMQGEKIGVFGDYDVDGATSSALLKRFFDALGSDIVVYIPDRMKEGYGPNSAALLKLHEQGVKVCVTVDCGTLAFEPLADAAKAGLEVIVIDHHLSADSMPEAVAVVNPNRLDETSEYTYLAAVGMAFLLAVAVNSKLKKQGWYEANHRKQPDLLGLLDLVALGTVCDVVPLKAINRAFVTQGLKLLSHRRNIGLKALADVAGVNDDPGAYHLGFVLGPRINAGGRVGKADLGTRLLSTEDEDEAFNIAQQLDCFNAERQAIEQQVLEEAIAQVDAMDTTQALLFAVGKNWHPGVIGIVASRLKERYHRPVAVISVEKGVGKASARSISGVDFGAAVVAANQSEILLAGGGHAMAAGFTVEENKIDDLHAFLSGRFTADVQQNEQRILKLDSYLTVKGVNVELAESIQQLGPFGTSNPEPRFVFADVCLIKVDVIGKDHIRCIIADSKVAGQGGSIKAMAFRSLDTPMGQTLLAGKAKKLHISGRVRVNRWQGLNKPEILIDDVAQ